MVAIRQEVEFLIYISPPVKIPTVNTNIYHQKKIRLNTRPSEEGGGKDFGQWTER